MFCFYVSLPPSSLLFLLVEKLRMNVVFSQKTSTQTRRKQSFKVPLTCFLCHSLEPNDNPQKYPRKAHLDDEQLLSLSSPGFAPPPVQHHSSSSDCLRHRFNHHTGHGALLSRAFRRYPRWWCRGTRTRGEEAEAHKLTVRVLKLLDGRRYDWLLDGFVKFTRL